MFSHMRMAVSNSTGKEKLKYNDIRDLILAEEFAEEMQVKPQDLVLP